MSTIDTATLPSNPPRGLIRLEKARTQLAYIWTYGTASVIVLLTVRTVNFPEHAQELWAWALPTIMPTASLIFSVMAATALVHLGDKDEVIFVRSGFFGLARAVSVFYLALLGGWIMVGAPLVAARSGAAHLASGFGAATNGGANAATAAVAVKSEFMEALLLANYFISPVQSILVGLISAMFFAKDKNAKASDAAPESTAGGTPSAA